MKTKRMGAWVGAGLLTVALLWAAPVSAQTTFSSGSTGVLGAFAPAANTVVTLPSDGVLNYTTVTIPAGVTVTFVKNAANTPVTMLATGDVLVNGVINVNGTNGINASSSATVQLGGAPGPGGFAGGQSGSRGLTNNTASTGYGPGGGAGSVAGVSGAVSPTYGAPTSFIALLPLFGGSGGGGGAGDVNGTGAAGGGGGGAIVLASSTHITVGGAIIANGGNGGQGGASITHAAGGSGGAIRLVAPQITSSGTMTATGGSSAFFLAGPPGNGRIRIEALVTGFINPTTPTASISTTLGPITAASVPALINLPTVTISAVGGVASPAVPTGSYTTADVALPAGTTNPVPVTLTVNNIPLGTVFTVKLVPQFAAATNVSSSAASGTFTSSTATANVTFPNGQISTLNAFAGFTLTASLMPLIDGEPAEQVLVAANWGEPSTVTLRTKSGKEMRADQLSHGDQVKLARAWESYLRGR